MTKTGFHSTGCTELNDASASEVCICEPKHPYFIGYVRMSFCIHPNQDWCDCDWCRINHHWTK